MESPFSVARVLKAAVAFAVAGGLIAWVVVGYSRLETWGLYFLGREALVGLLAGGVATLGLRRTIGVYAACTIGLVGIAFGTPIMLISLQASSGDTNMGTLTCFALFQGVAFAVLGVGLSRVIERTVLTIGLPVAVRGAIGGVAMAMPFTSFRPRDESMEGWIVMGLVVSLATAGAWAGYVLARRRETLPTARR